MKELRGKPVSDKIEAEVREKSKMVEAMLGRPPKLCIVRCGERADDLSYEKGVTKKAQAFGIEVETESFPEKVDDATFLHAFAAINESRKTDGILLMRPLPKQLNEGFVTSCVDAEKDIDGVSPVNAAGLYFGTDCFAPCTAQAVMELLHFYNISLDGKQVVILGRSAVVGKPLAMLMLAENATVTVCHSHTKDLPRICRRADILVSAIGRARFVTEEFVKRGAVVIDVGINTDAEGKLCGDVDFASCSKKARAMTPVPGGLGAVTSAVLLKHVLQAANRDIL